MWFPFPFWLIGAVIFVAQMASAPPNFYKRLAVGMLITTCLWAVLFIVVATSVGIAGTYSLTGLDATLGVMLPIQCLLMAGFIAAADMAFRAAFGPLTFDLSNMRELRGVHLGLNLAGMFIFPIFTYIGIPLTLAKVSRHRRNHNSLFGWSVACGTLTLLVVTVVIFLAAITSGTAPIEYVDDDEWHSRCRKRAALQSTDMNMTMSIVNSTSMSIVNSTSMLDNSTTWDTTTTTVSVFDPSPTTAICWDAVPHSSNAWTAMLGPGWMIGAGWNPRRYSDYYSNMLQQPDVIIAVVSLSLFAWLFHIFFIAFTDKIILQNIERGQESGVVVSQVPSNMNAQQLVHPCASCGTHLQFMRTGPTTQVQCFQCGAIVEFTTA